MTAAPLLTIREFRESDRRFLSHFYLRCRQRTFHWLPQELFQLEDFNKDTSGELILVAELDSKIMGFISIWAPDRFIHNLFIDNDLIKMGFGSKLLESGLKLISRPAWLKCLVANEAANRFYLKNGWVIDGPVVDGPLGPYYNFKLFH
jgi:ribosomal protein S18 acetylase RimI-like enzyme